MKEITTVVMVQITAVDVLDDDEMAEWAETKDACTKKAAEIIKRSLRADDVLTLSRKDFVRDVDEKEEDDG